MGGLRISDLLSFAIVMPPNGVITVRLPFSFVCPAGVVTSRGAVLFLVTIAPLACSTPVLGIEPLEKFIHIDEDTP